MTSPGAKPGSLQETDILIVGAGLVGSAMALLLATSEKTRHLQVTLVDPVIFKPAYSDSAFDNRVIALTEASHQLLEGLGIWESVQYRCCGYEHMQVEDAEGTGTISFHAGEVQQPCLGHIAENSLIVEQLLARLQSCGQVHMICPGKVVALRPDESKSGYQVELDNGDVIQPKLIVAADGANSSVRSMAGLGIREWSYGHHAIVATIRTEKTHGLTARQWFTTDGPLAFLPLAGPPDPELKSCSIVWSQRSEQAERLMALADDMFCRELSNLTKGELGHVLNTGRRFSFPLTQRHARDYWKPGLVVVGDAAHSIHPLAGQGANLGFLDVAALQDAIEWGLKGDLSPGDERILQRYQQQRRPGNLRMMALMEGFKQLFGSKAPPLRVIRNLGMSRVNRLTPLKSRLVREAMGIS